jgi:hypothetical protein
VVLANLLNTGLDPLPGVNVAFLLSLVVTLALTFLVLPYGKRRAAWLAPMRTRPCPSGATSTSWSRSTPTT